MSSRDPRPEILRLEELVDSIRRGEIRLPKFQRPFVWDQQDMLDLWDSIYNGYPIGSVLLWHSSERLKSEREIYGFAVNPASIERYPTDYLLDGQQRLTTVCGALFWEGSEVSSPWAISFDLETEKFLYPKGSDETRYFPLNRLINTGDFIRQCMKFESHPRGTYYYSVAERLLKAVKDYKVAVVKIGDVSLDEVAPIFERINSTGRKLTMVDLMRAATWREGFDLTEAIEESAAEFRAEGFEVADNIILRGIASAAGLGINKGDIDRLRSLDTRELRIAVAASRTATNFALSFLRDHIGVDDMAALPYAVQLTHLSEFFRYKQSPGEVELESLQRWFWITSVSRYFTGASTGQNSKDLNSIREFALTGRPLATDSGAPLDCAPFLVDDFNLRTAASTTFILILRSKRRAGSEDLQMSGRLRRSRADYSDFLSKSVFRGKNIGQVFSRQRSGSSLPLEDYGPEDFIDGDCLKFLSESRHEMFVEHRGHLIAEYLSILIRRPCTIDQLVPTILSRAL